MSARHWADAYVGIPYKDGDTGLHCWGLVRKVLADRARVEVPAYAEVDATELAAITSLIDATTPSWIEVGRPAVRELDVAVMHGWLANPRTGRPERGVAHVGIVVDGGLLLHVDSPHDAVLIPLDHASVRHRFAGFYRHRDLA